MRCWRPTPRGCSVSVAQGTGVEAQRWAALSQLSLALQLLALAAGDYTPRAAPCLTSFPARLHPEMESGGFLNSPTRRQLAEGAPPMHADSTGSAATPMALQRKRGRGRLGVVEAGRRACLQQELVPHPLSAKACATPIHC